MKYFFLNNGSDLEEKNLLHYRSLAKNYFTSSITTYLFHASHPR